MTKEQVQRLMDELEGLAARLSKVEAVHGVKKSITGQDSDGDTKDKLWPSIRIET